MEDFNELIKKYEKQNLNLNLLLGNGFSCALNPADFENSNFEEEMGSIRRKKEIHTILKNDDSSKEYELKYEDLKRIFEKNIFISNYLNSPKAEEKQACLKKLLRFNNIFTLNHDLLLHSVLSYAKDDEKTLVDGFSMYHNGREIDKNAPLYWDNTMPATVFYLHGALHLFEDKDKCTRKIRKSKSPNSKDLRDIIIDDYINENIKLLLVKGSDYLEKTEQIKNSLYLTHCFEKFCEIEGTIFIHGHSLSERDGHIFEAINENPKIKDICISVYSPKENEEQKRENAEKVFDKKLHKKLHFYDAEKVRIWN